MLLLCFVMCTVKLTEKSVNEQKLGRNAIFLKIKNI